MSNTSKAPKPTLVPTRVQVLEAVQRAGFPFEGRVLDVLQRHGYYASPSWAFPDPDTETSREIDVVANKHFTFPEDPGRTEVLIPGMSVHLIVECKKTLSLVLYDVDPPGTVTGEHEFRMAYFGDPDTMWSRSSEGWPASGAIGEPMHARVGFGDSVWPWPKHVGVHYSFITPQDKGRPDRGFNASDDDFYNSRFHGFLKGIRTYRESYFGRLLPGVNAGVRPALLVPLLLVDGDVWAYRASRRTRLRKITHGSLVTTYWGSFYGKYRIDILTERALPRFLKSLDAEVTALAARLGGERDALERSSALEARMRTKKEPAG